MKFLVRKAVSLFSFALVSCSSPVPKPVEIESNSNGAETIDFGYKESLPEGYYVVIENNNGSWRVIDISRTRIFQRPNLNSEILFFNLNLKYAQPVFEKVKHFNGSTFECTPLTDDKLAYTPCQSELTSTNLGMSVGKNVFAAALSFGLASGYHTEIDREKIADAIQSSNVIPLLRKKKPNIDAEYSERSTQIRAAQYQAHKAAIELERQRKELELEVRRSQLPQIQQIGASICKDVNSRLGKIRYFGYVEGVANTRIQIRVADAHIVGTTLSPGGFQSSIIWDEALNWLPCQ